MADVILEQWTVESVREALTLAYRVLDASEGRVGHKRLRAAMPDFELEYKRPMKGRERFSATEIWHADLVLVGGTIDGVPRRSWLNGRLMNFPERRAVLIAACYAASRRYSLRQLSEILLVPESTLRWQRDWAAGVLAAELNAAKVEAWC